MASSSNFWSVTVPCPRICSGIAITKGASPSPSHRIMCLNYDERQYRKLSVVQNQQETKGGAASSSRRDILLHTLFIGSSSLASFTPFSFALNEVTQDFQVYMDDVNKFKIMIPKEWQVGNGEAKGIRSVTAFYPLEASNSNVSVVITGLGADFTRLESFGKVDAFAENLVNGLDRSWQRPPGVAAKLIDCRAANGLYYIEYTLQNPGESLRHIFSAIGMQSNGWYNRLYTVTGQYVEEESAKYSSKIEKAVGSFRLI
ncbi:PsbP, C-terminal [Dillenia turbinata]|uniref:PsbP, C-terminal n=1 Tax=Dillenia turbinata TaxID=194707 RepID=A0AAN8ZIH9_9MAGN